MRRYLLGHHLQLGLLRPSNQLILPPQHSHPRQVLGATMAPRPEEAARLRAALAASQASNHDR